MTAPLTLGAPVTATTGTAWDGVSPSVAGQAYQGTPPGWVDPDKLDGTFPTNVQPAWATDESFLHPPQFQVQNNLDEWGAVHVVGPRFTVFNGITIDNYANEYTAIKNQVAAGLLSPVGTGLNADLDAEANGAAAKASAAVAYGASHGSTDPINNTASVSVPVTQSSDPWGITAPIPSPSLNPAALPPSVNVLPTYGAMATLAPAPSRGAIIATVAALLAVGWFFYKRS